jgi:uncharacterized protein YndB with AHSA1/START domain
MLEAMHGTYEIVDDRSALTFERRLAHSVERVWRAVTEPAELAHWFPSAMSGDLRPGGTLTFEFPGGEMPAMQGEVIEVDPPRSLAFTWGDDMLRIELVPDGEDGCVLHFVVLFDDAERASRDAAGWHVCLERLEQHLGGTATQAPTSDATPDWRALYEEYQRRGLPAGAPLPGD